MRQSRISLATIASRSLCLEINPYKALGEVIRRLRVRDPRCITQEKFGAAIGFTRAGAGEVEAGNRRLDLFEVKDIAVFFSEYSPELKRLRLVFDNYFPQGNHGTLDIHKQVGNLIYKARELDNISRPELSQWSGISESSLWRIESGYSRIYLLEAWAIARLLSRDEQLSQLDNALSDLLVGGESNQLVAS